MTVWGAQARKHALVLARDPELLSIYDLRAQHVPLLQHIILVGEQIAEDWREQANTHSPCLCTCGSPPLCILVTAARPLQECLDQSQVHAVVKAPRAGSA